MRLSKLKLAGFKSFVDPTTVTLPSELVAVVGPNGCGKSNIIDAVRWVMGESSAKHLRGDSMADVIFNGSSTRKPVGQAMIELIFDNSDGQLDGQYANYNEIAVKRTVSRDGTSNYYLNSSRCRRKDITDLFLGTGLGPRSYAIIEQGTISRIIEAKPEELRIFLEEAAGISKYKERRRETENRIRHTRDNLDRLNDLRDELEKQLERLKRQARTAERYKVLKEEERLVRGQLLALRWNTLNNKSASSESGIREQETALEAAIARQRGIETDIEKQREAHTEANEKLNEVQSRYYSVGTEIARLEQSIQHSRERRQQQQQDLAQLEKDWQAAQTHISTDRDKIQHLEQTLTTIDPELNAARESELQTQAALQEAEQAMSNWQAEWEAFNEAAAEPARQAEVERTRIEHLELHLQQQQQRLERVENELDVLNPDALQAELASRQSARQESELRIQQLQAQLNEQQHQISRRREQNHELNDRLDQARRQMQDLRGRNASLEALQQAALGKQQGVVNNWLLGRQLDQAPRLAEKLDVANGWERAVECVLGAHLEAVCVNDVDPVAAALDGLQEGSLTLFDTTVAAQQNSAPGGEDLLRDKITAPWSLDSLFAGVHIAESLNDALAMRSRLSAHESVVTREGIWLGSTWLRVVRDQDERAGVLQREQELKLLASDIETVGQQIATSEQQFHEGREQLKALDAQRDQLQSELQQANRQHVECQSALSAVNTRLEQARSRHGQLSNEKQEAQQQTQRDTEELGNARRRLQDAIEKMSSLERQREQLIQQRNALRQQLDDSRQRAQTDRQHAHDIALRAETLRTELTSTQQALTRMDNQIQQLSGRREELQAALSEGEAPITQMSAELEMMLAKRVTIENELNEARSKVQALEHQMRELESARNSAEEAVQIVRAELEQLRMAWQEIKVRRQTLEEQVRETGFQLRTLLDEMPEAANEETWTESVEELERKINRLGPINLAAIDEFEQQSERKKYLDEQNADLMEALDTLENAIRKIDKETRSRFQETFDKVNTGLQDLFPRMFGGGHAYLEMTSEDLLDAGITVMARPPGKRNSSIHLLSGGEKALTAVSLVFSLFQLNPAPFCMLDEVDAPLDDANVGRYCDMLKYMSDKTQFIFITHNKVTMEAAKHLTGVTMNEPGVSRLVAVDIEEAAKLAAV